MAVVPVPEYAPGQVTERAMPDTYQQAADFGGGRAISAGLQNLAQGGEQFAAGQAQRQDMVDEANTKQLDIQYSTMERQLLYDPNTGYLTTAHGLNAINGADAVTQQLADHAQGLMDQANTPQQKRMLADVIGRRLAASQQAVSQHAAQGGQQYLQDTSNARIIAEQGNATVNYQDPTAFANSMATIDTENAKLGQMSGVGGDLVEQERLNKHTEVHSQIIENMLTQGSAQTAMDWLNQHVTDMTAPAATKLRAQVTEKLYDQLAFTNAQAGILSGTMGNSGQPAGSATPGQPGTPGAIVSPPPGTNPVADQIRATGKAQGWDATKTANLIAMGMAESGLKDIPNAKGTSSNGYFQFQPSDWQAAGGGDIHDVGQNITNASTRYDQDAASLTKRGIPVNLLSLYMLHQQGPAGGPALLKADPTAKAIDVLAPLYTAWKGVAGPDIARQAIMKNTIGPADPNITVGDFLDRWNQRLGGTVASVGQAVGASAPYSPGTPPPRPNLADMDQHAAAVAGGNPVLLSKMMAANRQALKEYDSNRTAMDGNAVDAVQPYLRDPSIHSVGQIPQNIWAALPETTKTSVYEHFSNGGQFAKADDPLILKGIYDTHANNPTGMANFDPTPYAGQLTQSTYEKVLQWRADAQAGKGEFKPEQIQIGRVMGASSALLASAGITTKTNPQALATFQTRLMSELGPVQASHPDKPLTDQEIHSVADRLLLNGTWMTGKKGMLGDDQTASGRLFMAPPGALSNADVPPDIEAKIRADFAARGRPNVTRGDVSNAYVYGHAQGIYK